MIGVKGVVANIARGDAKDRYSGRGCYLFFEAVEVAVDGFGFPAGVGEDRVVDLGEDSFRGEREERTGLNSGTE